MIEGSRDEILPGDVDRAIDEMLFSGGRLNRALLGADDATASGEPPRRSAGA